MNQRPCEPTSPLMCDPRYRCFSSANPFVGFGNFERNRLTSFTAIVDAGALENKLNLWRSAEAGRKDRRGAATAPCGITSFNVRELSFELSLPTIPMRAALVHNSAF